MTQQVRFKRTADSDYEDGLLVGLSTMSSYIEDDLGGFMWGVTPVVVIAPFCGDQTFVVVTPASVKRA